MCSNPDFTITVSVVNGAISLSGGSGSGGDLNVPLDQNQTKYIDLDLDSAAISAGYDFYGIKISQNSGDITSHPSTVDSNGQFWDNTCFKVSNSNNLHTLCLTDQDRKTHQDSGIDWFYCVGVKKGSDPVIWDDPKIHNQGDGYRCISYIRDLEAH